MALPGIYMPALVGSVGSPILPLEIDYIGSQGDFTNSASTINWTDVTVSEPGLLVVFITNLRVSSHSLVSCTIGGVSATELRNDSAYSGNWSSGVFGREVTAGTYSISYTLSSSGDQSQSISVFLIKNYQSITPEYTFLNNYGTNWYSPATTVITDPVALDFTLTIPADGGMISSLHYVCSHVSIFNCSGTYTGITEVYDDWHGSTAVWPNFLLGTRTTSSLETDRNITCGLTRHITSGAVLYALSWR